MQNPCEKTMSEQQPQRKKVWLVNEQKVATVRKVEIHPNWGRQFLVTTHSNEWGPETFWVKESDVQEDRR
jgi:hypothetical protein